jgi:3-deoxy-D-manno-octulosonic-acid transferase
VTELLLFLENLLFPLGALAIVLKFALSPRRGALKSLRAELPERFGRVLLPAGLPEKGRVWVHCASAGEVNAAAALVARLAARGKSVVVTATTAAGRERAAALKGAAAASFAPLDCAPAVDAFLERVQPEALLLVETELWPQTIALTTRHDIPVAVVNGRLSERSFSRYRLLSPMLRPLLSCLKVVAAQTEADAERFRALGAPAVEVAGNMKHDLPGAGEASAATRAAFARLGWDSAPVFVAGSTHPGEELAVLGAFRAARAVEPRLKLVIAPRHLERAADCEARLRQAGLSYSRWSSPEAGREALLVDTMGALGQLYALGTVAFVGGTLVPVGGHNLLEPALAGVPVLFGPHAFAQAQSARLLESAGAGFCAADAGRLTTLLRELLADPARLEAQGELARKTARTLQGAVARTEALIAPLLR